MISSGGGGGPCWRTHSVGKTGGGAEPLVLDHPPAAPYHRHQAMSETWAWASLPVGPGATWHAGGWWPTLQSGVSGQLPVRLTTLMVHGFSNHGAAFAHAAEVSQRMRAAAQAVLDQQQPVRMEGPAQ